MDRTSLEIRTWSVLHYVLLWYHSIPCYPYSGLVATSLALWQHYSDVIMGQMASQITGILVVNSTVWSGRDQRKHQSSASLAFVWGVHRWPVNSLLKGPVTRNMFPFGDIIMNGTNAPVPLKLPWRIWVMICTNLSVILILTKAQQNHIHISWDILYTCHDVIDGLASTASWQIFME